MDLSRRLEDWISFTSWTHAVSLSDLIPDPPCLFPCGREDTSCRIRRHQRLRPRLDPDAAGRGLRSRSYGGWQRQVSAGRRIAKDAA